MAVENGGEIPVRDIVLGLDRKVDQLARDMSDVKVIAGTVGSNVATLLDHESRLRALEKFRYGVPSIATVAVLIALASLLYGIFGHH